MEGTRIEILNDGSWKKLRLRNDNDIKYNAVINRIGNIENREISHTNTFSLPLVHQNIQALGINIFHPGKMAKALNTKYEARYYVKDLLLQVGYLVLNNTEGGSIQVNFIDSALNLTSIWDATSYKELLYSERLEIPTDFQVAIAELRDYTLPINAVLPPLTNVGVRGYPIGLFPNNLNAIGDKFQLDENGIRVLDVFNPYQSRPIFNAKAFIDLVCEGFGYTTEFLPSVDTSLLEKTYIVNKGLNESQRNDGGLETVLREGFGTNNIHYYDNNDPISDVQTVMTFGNGNPWSAKPNDIPNWVDPPAFLGDNVGSSYKTKPCVYLPNTIESFLGNIQFQASISPTTPAFQVDVYTVWENITPGNDVVFKVLPTTLSSNTINTIDFTSAKTEFNIPPIGGGTFLGVIVLSSGIGSEDTRQLSSQKVAEQYVPSGVVAYDEFAQFTSVNVNLSYAAPDTSIKEILASVMQKEGLLLSIDGINKNVKFFTYGQYKIYRDSGDYVDWSKYFRKYSTIGYNTDYGNSYGKLNKIALTNPYPGNIYNLIMTNQGSDSKYKSLALNYVKGFADITQVTRVDNTVPFFEYENKGLGLVEDTLDPLTGLNQQRADNSAQGPIISLPKMSNVNYAAIPNGVVDWYKLVDEALRSKAIFLLPYLEIKNLDISKPVFINDLNGFWIIEEIEEYTNAQTEVQVKLIKLIDDLNT